MKNFINSISKKIRSVKNTVSRAVNNFIDMCIAFLHSIGFGGAARLVAAWSWISHTALFGIRIKKNDMRRSSRT